jgi:hypothetical protein
LIEDDTGGTPNSENVYPQWIQLDQKGITIATLFEINVSVVGTHTPTLLQKKTPRLRRGDALFSREEEKMVNAANLNKIGRV